VDNVELPLIYAGMAPHARRERALAALQNVALGDRVHHKPNELSGGQRQRVAIARALVNHPSIILADEPTGNLDSRTSLEIVGLLASLCRERGVTVVSATHDHRMLDVSDRVVYLRNGLIERVAPRSELRIEASSVSTPS
jgi:putative ABC transport system ATP-binding protein